MNIVFMSMDTLPSTLWARDLYDQMHIRSDFRKWFPRMCQYGFIEGRDYEYMPRVRLQDEGGRTVQRYVKDYRITQDMAKKLCKLHHTAVGAAYHQTLMVFYIPGCTMVFNNCLMRKIQERKPEFDLITMHDCWLYYICLGIGGKIISDKNAYIQYRQHGNNVIGAKRISIRKKIQMICQQNGSPRAKMIDEIIRLYGQDMKKEMLSKYKTFASYPKSIKAKNYFFKQSTENVFSTRELQKAKLRILFGSL